MKAISRLRSDMLLPARSAHIFCSAWNSGLGYKVLSRKVDVMEVNGRPGFDSDLGEMNKETLELEMESILFHYHRTVIT